MNESVSREIRKEEEDATILPKLPRTFRIFLVLEDRVKKEKGTPLRSDTTPETIGGDP